MKQNKYVFLWRYIRPAAWSFVAAIVSVEIATLTGMLHPQIIRAAIDCAIGKGEPNYPPFVMKLVESVGGFSYLGSHLWIMALAIVACAVVQMVFQYAFRVINTKATETMVKAMRDELYSHIQRLPYEWHTRNQTGDIIQRCTSDVETIKGFVSGQLASLLRVGVMLCFALFFMIGMNGMLTLIAMLPLIVVVVYSIYYHKIVEERFMACDENEGKLSAIAQENLTGVRVVRAFGRESHELDKFMSHNKFYTSLWVKLSHSLALFWSVSDVLSGLQLLLLMVVGILYCHAGKLTAGEYIAFIAYNGMLVWPIRELGRTISEMGKTGVSIERVR
ncbi:MAG: ABC transporter ATP-binding protein, partial [Victivallales bacterium]|nr:ABC transporter ATP-binding protein [Victivallales bacterium]